MPQLVAHIDASGKDITLTLMSIGKKETTGSEKMLASKLVKAAASDPSIPVTSVASANGASKTQ